MNANPDLPHASSQWLARAEAAGLQPLHIRGKTLLPIVQGGMGVGVSASGLASAVARLGGMGTISSVDLRRRHADLMAQTGWRDTVDMRYEVVALSATKAHLILRSGTRVRADGSPIEDISGFYAWTRTPAGWKMFAISDVRTPR